MAAVVVVVVVGVAGVADGSGVVEGAVVAGPVRAAVVAVAVCTDCAPHICRGRHFRGSTR